MPRMNLPPMPSPSHLEVLAPAPCPPARPGSWSLMEARLTTARVEDLLTDAEQRLQRLASTEELLPEIAAAVEGTLADVREGLARMGSARRCLRSVPTDHTAAASTLRIVPRTADPS
jgi:hypothetical protein